MMSEIKQSVFMIPMIQQANQDVKNVIGMLVDQFNTRIVQLQDQGETEEKKYKQQFQVLFKTLNNPSKLAVLKDFNHRSLIISFIKQEGIEHYKYSYYNRAKLTKTLVSMLDKYGPILFSEAVMIASKTNLINKNNSRFFIEDHLYTQSESPVDMKIQQILKLCDEKKRNVNNNFKKLELILDGPDSLQVIKELGKMLRDSWKKDKSKIKCTDIVKQSAKHSYRQGNYQFEKIEVYEQDIRQEQSQKCGSQKLSFTSSQNEIIKERKEHVKEFFNEQLRIFEDDSMFSLGSQIFQEYPANFDFV